MDMSGIEDGFAQPSKQLAGISLNHVQCVLLCQLAGCSTLRGMKSSTTDFSGEMFSLQCQTLSWKGGIGKFWLRQRGPCSRQYFYRWLSTTDLIDFEYLCLELSRRVVASACCIE